MSRLAGRTRLHVARLTAPADRPRGASTPWIVLAIWVVALAFCLTVSWSRA